MTARPGATAFGEPPALSRALLLTQTWRMRIRAVGGLLLLLSACAPTAGPMPASPPVAVAEAVVAREQGPLRLVIVHWKIKPGREAEFLTYWSERARVADRAGLVGEFLSGVEDRATYPWMTMASLDRRWTSYFNVGLWRDAAAFQEQIGRFIDIARPPLDFEAERRERVLLAAERWRRGTWQLPADDPPGVR